jgi:hypothetical protein
VVLGADLRREREAQGGGELASGGPGAAIYREEKGKERRTVGRHGGSERENQGIGPGRG